MSNLFRSLRLEVLDTRCLPVVYQLDSINLGMYTAPGENPNNGPGQITTAELDTRLNVIAPYTKAVRIFGATGDLEPLPAKARAKGLDVILTAYLTDNLPANAIEIQKLKEQAAAGRVQLAVVGSEVLQRGELTPAALIAYINEVKSYFAANNINVPVTTADTYTKLLEHPEVIAACDTVVYANIYGFWENQPVNVAVAALDRAYNRLRAAAPTKTIRISETGWPSDGSPRGAAVPSLTNAAYYFQNFISWARAKNVHASYFAAFDEPWKFNTEGDVGPHWGLFDGNFNLKAGMQSVFDGQTLPDNWSTLDFFTSVANYTTNIGMLPITGATGTGNTVRINDGTVPPTSVDSQGALAHAYPLTVGTNTITLDVLDSGGLVIASATKNITYDPNHSTLENELLYVDSVASSLDGTLVLDTQRQLLLGLLPGHVRGVAPNATELYMADRTVLSTSTHQSVRTLPFSQPLATNNFVVTSTKLFVGTEVVEVASNTLLTSNAPNVGTGNSFGGAAVPGGPSATGDGALIYANSDLVRIDTATLTSTPVPVARSAFVSDYTVHPDGDWLLASSYGGGSQVYSYDLREATPTLAATIALGDFTGETAFLREPWAVAGSAGNPANGGGRFTVFNYQTGAGATTIFSPLADNLAISADGQHFYITTGDDLGVTAYHVATDGTVTRDVTYNLGINRSVVSSGKPANDDIRQLVVKPALDFTPPVVTLVSHPESVTPSTDATFSFAATDTYGSGVDDYEVRIDGGSFVAASSPITFNNLPTGPHTFEVRASDVAGNVSSPLTFNWHILVPPTNTLPLTFTGTEDTPMTLAGISIQDADAGNDPLAVSFHSTAGMLTLRDDVVGGVTSSAITGNNSPTLTIVAPLVAINNTLTATQGLVFTGAANAEGVFTLTLQTNDNGNMGSSVALTDSDTSTVTLVGTNDAPTIVQATTTLTPVPQNSTTGLGDTVSVFVAATLSDSDGNAQQGIAITAVDASQGTWQFSLDDGATWANVGSVSTANALLLRDTDRVRFVPQTSFVGAATLTYHGWDQTAHNAGDRIDLVGNTGGTTSLSMANCVATVTVGIALSDVREDTKAPAGDRVQKLVAGVAHDADGTTAFGVAVVGVTGTDFGTWQHYSSGKWRTLTATPNTALLLRETTKIRFVPHANQQGAALLWYRAWDQSTGVAGTRVDLTVAGSTGGATAFSLDAIPAFVNVVPVNDPPVLDVGGDPFFTPVTPSTTDLPGDRVRDLLGSTVTDIDGDMWQMALTAVGRVGSWQWQPFGSSDWQAVGDVSAKAPRFLQPMDRLRLVPNNGYIDHATLTYKVFDGQSYSRKSEQGTVRATGSMNTAPVLLAGGSMTSFVEDGKSKGDEIATLVHAHITDADSHAQLGIALTAVDANWGTWSYSIDRGGTWRPVGQVSTENALLLRGTDRVRFLPFKNAHGTATATFVAWDQTRGSSGQRANIAAAHLRGDYTAFSTATDTLTIIVQPVNDRPTLNTKPTVRLTSVLPTETNPLGDLAPVLLTGAADVDGDSLAVVVVGVSGNGEWERQPNGTGPWLPIDATRTSPEYLTTTDSVRFVPSANFRGQAKLQYQISDGQSLSTATETAIIVVNTTDDRPTINQTLLLALPSVLPNTAFPTGTLVADLLGSAVDDADLNSSIGIAITLAETKNGAWELATDGTSWQPLPTATAQAPQYLLRTSFLRFIPNSNFHGVVKLNFKAWDAASQNPTGPLALSATTIKALMAVNSAPIWS